MYYWSNFIMLVVIDAFIALYSIFTLNPAFLILSIFYGGLLGIRYYSIKVRIEQDKKALKNDIMMASSSLEKRKIREKLLKKNKNISMKKLNDLVEEEYIKIKLSGKKI